MLFGFDTAKYTELGSICSTKELVIEGEYSVWKYRGGNTVGIATSYRLNGLGVRGRVLVSSRIAIGPGAHQIPYSMGTEGSSPEAKAGRA
jgi:hypothetical protein